MLTVQRQNACGKYKSAPVVAVTMGDPAGVGPEIIVKALTTPDIPPGRMIVLGDAQALQRAIRLLHSPLCIRIVDCPEDVPNEHHPYCICLRQTSQLTHEDIQYGRPSRDACQGIVENIRLAVEWAQAGRVQAVCTCPINKTMLHRHGFDFPGHTEFLQHLTGTPRVVMMLAGPRLRVALVTIHHALADVPALLTHKLVRETVQITAHALQEDFGLAAPRIAVAALNPHAGENGRFGREEIDIIVPAIQQLNQEGMAVSGPYPPDTIFHRAYHGAFDAVIAMYHDQGLIPLKLVHFDNGVNITLGLPIIRTSVDHGTAYDIAGSGTAGADSLLAALRLAVFMAGNRFHG